ncbi:HlyD family efflux transporter periplasmic adaptor subunit [Aureisphaera sp. CAU 1614]|uniref:HlyD family efflux transporter periplasmic adaptor subunit n=1 Tax=Halomarinibacterium sedimenti TaxID=2857106 RepID=A0A9X1JUM9_9FLAO|nr:HlyD family efflux transporter periplasmic adaptor subunit [Halomarinibacterium sedimenti]MBW2936800.1 HlyD family efflux transporter periplasmic adaptor subunit [Halomarinibacterium sedimenti]
MRRILLSLIGVVIIGGALLGAYLIVKNSNKPKPQVQKIVKTVFTETAQNGSVPIVIPANGNLIAKNRLELYAEVQGIFSSSSHDFKTGQSYRKGEILLRMDASEYYASVQAAKSEFYNLVTSLMPDLRLDYPEAFPTWQNYLNSININKSLPPLPETSSEKVNYFITGRGVTTSYYNIKNLEQRLGKYSISAPFSGVLTEALVTKGTLIRQGQKLGEFIDTSVYDLELSIGKNYSDLLSLGEKVALNSIDGNDTYTGTVTRVNSSIDQATQTIKVYVEVKGEGLKEGMYLEAQLEAKEEPNAIKLSRKLLVNESEIFIVRDSILDVLEVEPVYFSSKDMVVKGIPNGTQVVSRPVAGAYAGMLVKVYKEAKTTDTTSTKTTE